MDPQFLHFPGNFDAAADRLNAWYGSALDPDEVDAYPEGNGWTTISVDCDYLDTENWLRLAQHLDVFYESYNTSTTMGEIVFCRDGKCVRHLLQDDENPDDNVNVGTLAGEQTKPLESWSDVWGFVDDAKWKQEVA